VKRGLGNYKESDIRGEAGIEGANAFSWTQVESDASKGESSLRKKPTTVGVSMPTAKGDRIWRTRFFVEERNLARKERSLSYTHPKQPHQGTTIATRKKKKSKRIRKYAFLLLA